MKKTFAGAALVATLLVALVIPDAALAHAFTQVDPFAWSLLPLTTLAANSPRVLDRDPSRPKNMLPVVASDIIYEGAVVGLVDASGHARPLNAADRFGGFAEAKADNSAGAAAAITVDVIEAGFVKLTVSGAVITDKGQPVYATDDDTFALVPTGGVFIGYINQFLEADVVMVHFDTRWRDPYGYGPRETLTGTKTFDAQDCGKTFFCTAACDGDALTMPAIADGLDNITIVAIGAFGTTQIVVDPAAADAIFGPDLTSVDNKDLLLTKATQRRGDRVRLGLGDADGYLVQELVGIWTKE
jgi:hypothetical protein